MLNNTKQDEIKALVNRYQNTMLVTAGSPEYIQDKVDAIAITKAIVAEGYSIIEIEEIASVIYGAEAIGYLDRITKTVYIKTGISQVRKNFTLAHELGHILMHKKMDVMHRQVARKKGHPRDYLEQEADYFASCWLMPKLLVIKQFEQRFLSSPMIFTDNVAFHLSKTPEQKQELLEALQTSGYRELIVSNVTTFNFKQFMSLAQYFQVSPEAMAIRLQELDLIIYP